MPFPVIFRRRRSKEPRLGGPIRGELLGLEGLAAYARALAQRQKLLPPERRGDIAPILRRLSETHQILRETREALNHASERRIDVSPAGDWLLDNFYVIDDHIRDIRENMPNDYYRELPKLAEGPLAGFPRVYEIAIELISHTEGHLDEENIGLFVSEFQRGAELSIGELWATPVMLRLGLMENIRRMALRVSHRLKEVEAADHHANLLSAASEEGPGVLGDALSQFVHEHPPFTPAFVARFLQQIRGYPTTFTPLVWLEEWIAEEGLPAAEAVARSNQHAALTQVIVANSITSLRTIGLLDWRRFFEAQSSVEQVLREDPTGDYPGMTFETRDRYRHVVERLAKRARAPEAEVARIGIGLAEQAMADASSPERSRHVGYWLVDRGLRVLEDSLHYPRTAHERFIRFMRRHPDAVYLGGIAAVTGLLLYAALEIVDPGTTWRTIATIVLTIIPASQIAVVFINRLFTLILPPWRLQRLEFRQSGIPAEFRTTVAVPTLFADVAAVQAMLEHLEVQYLANRDPHLHFAILSDVADASSEVMSGDEDIVAAAVQGVHELNRKYAGGADEIFYLLHRPRRWNERESIWMGWERKRGKLAEFNRFLRAGNDGAFSTIVGNVEILQRTRYVITLDSDTVLPRDQAQVLAGTLAHPLNRAVYDPERGRVVAGYGILQPRVDVSLTSASRSRFAAIHSGHPGVDPYTTAVSDVYQDLYAEGSFTGKGIYDVAAFERATAGRFPENRLLSHDLIEGTFARAALVTDVAVYDDYPTRYLTYLQRKERWIRGDWQLLRWLAPWVPGPDGRTRNRLSRLSLWKIFDNLRRSLVEISQLALLVAIWLLLPEQPLVWTLVALAAMGFPWILPLLIALLHPPVGKSWRAYYESVLRDARLSALQFLLYLAFLPHEALVSATAIVRTLGRLLITRRKLLQWTTAAQIESVTLSDRAAVWRAMAAAVVVALLIGGLVVVQALRLTPSQTLTLLIASFPLITLWLGAPGIAQVLGAPVVPGEVRLSGAAQETALRYALLHWRFFDRFVGEATHGLAPDNFQEDPLPIVALRTSPTNIGLHLLAIVGAHDLGFTTLDDMTSGLERVFRTLERLDRFRGHFFNWYDLIDLRVLEPRYVSTVDSGNLAGHMLALKQAMLALPDQALAPPRLDDVNRAALRLAAAEGPEAAHWREWAATLGARHESAFRQLGVDPANATEITLRQAAALSTEASEQLARLEAIASRANEYAAEMDFRFLYDSQRRLFSIGYRESEGERDNSYYDLLASEARLASYLAVATDDVEVEHWFRLGRGLTTTRGDMALASWSGSMFEYLMPVLVMRTYPFTLLDQSCRSAVRRHITYGRERDVPWGFSESAYNLRDRHGTYQYRAFGVPDLALKRGLAKDLVVAPYASLLALLIEPRAALRNLQVLEAQGALGPYGFRDAVDYTRPEDGKEYAVVYAYMAHHLGMGFAALVNALRRQIWQERFHADPIVRSGALLLHERIPPRTVVKEVEPQGADAPRARTEMERPAVREFLTAHTPQPRIALLGNYPYTVLLTNAGSGYSRFEDMAVTRWRNDATRDYHGQFGYVKDVATNRVWSTAFQPTCREPDAYRAEFAIDRVLYERRDGPLETRTEITVVADDHTEVRRTTVVNHGPVERIVELTSYGEIVLTHPDADRAHPAFSNLFVQTEWLPVHSAILASRRPRSAEETRLWCAHVAAAGPELIGPITFDTDRARFLGRGCSTRDPAALEDGALLAGSVGAVLDPIFALRARVRLRAGGSARVAFSTIVSRDRDRVIELADRYNDPHSAQRALDLSWTHSQVQLRDLGISPADAALFQQLAGHLLFYNAAMRPSGSGRLERPLGRRALWANGISGDWPIILAKIETEEGLPSVRQLLQAHQFWRLKGVIVDLVIINTRASGYQQELGDQLLAMVLGSSEGGLIDRPGGVFIRRIDLMPPDELAQLRAVARVHVDCDGLGVGRMLDASEPEIVYPPVFDGATPATQLTTTPQPVQPPLAFQNQYGGMHDSGDYEIRLERAALPPMPWANVIANRRAGFCVTERGGGFTWVDNSYFYRLTPWSNDPVTDPVSEAIYLRDESSGLFWCPTPGPVRGRGRFTIRHGAGRSAFDYEQSGIATSLELGVAEHDPVKISRLRITNNDKKRRRLSVTSYVEWSLGVLREHTQHQVRVQYHQPTGALLARNTFEPEFKDHVAFSWLSEPLTSYTADRREFLGRNGDAADPAALHREGLAGRSGLALDPCAALQCEIVLAPGESRELILLLGAAEGITQALALIAKYGARSSAVDALDTAVAAWDHRLSTLQVSTPAPELDAMVNRWALYQALSCRMWGRSAVYQSSGAYGFRDQLQDVMAFVYAEPQLAREHILRCASRQFVEGDVQHWWHPHTGRGTRTRFSDDLVWLPFAVDHYVQVTGDASVLDEVVPFLSMRPLAPEEHELYELPQEALQGADIYEHCARALEHACTHGPHDLPLIGSGDWNDGMNRVGIEGRGESVWLAWFLIATLRRFVPYCEARADKTRASRFRTLANDYAVAAHRDGWDGEWYRRAYFDDGTPLGSAQNEECRIDSIAQSWSIISAAGEPTRSQQALQSMHKYLVREQERMILLLTPPFDHTPHDPGYIKGYLPGVRENGAQYTHAAIWAVLAAALNGDGDQALKLFQLINPLNHARTPEETLVYMVEPYVVPADVYSAEGHVGRGGWTWYTGSASWLYRVAVEAILGFTRRGDSLLINPCIPSHWDKFEIRYRFGRSTYLIEVQNPDGNESGIRAVMVDGVVNGSQAVSLIDDGAQHHVLVEMGEMQPARDDVLAKP